jgi:hypothetical protein
LKKRAGQIWQTDAILKIPLNPLLKRGTCEELIEEALFRHTSSGGGLRYSNDPGTLGPQGCQEAYDLWIMPQTGDNQGCKAQRMDCKNEILMLIRKNDKRKYWGDDEPLKYNVLSH